MRVLAIDQARKGAWAIGDSESGELLEYGAFSFDGKKYTYAQAISMIDDLVSNLIGKNNIDIVFIEDIQMRRNVLSYKRLAQLQGVLINLFEKKSIPYDVVPPAKWQSYCMKSLRECETIDGASCAYSGKKDSKMLSIQFAQSMYGVETENDNVADAISILSFVLHKEKNQMV